MGAHPSVLPLYDWRRQIAPIRRAYANAERL
jgi:hypothetical protein